MAALTPEQRDLLERFLANDDYSTALQVLDHQRAIVDDLFLANVVARSRWLYADGNYVKAADIAEIGMAFDDLASPHTNIDLCISAGQAFAQLSERQLSAVTAYESAVRTAVDARTSYMVPLAKLMLAQFARTDGRLSEARDLFLEAARGSLDADSAVDVEVFWKALTRYVGTLAGLNPRMSARDQNEAFLAMVPRRLLAEASARFRSNENDEYFLEAWAKARVSANILVEGIDPYDERMVRPIAGVLQDSLVARVLDQGENPPPGGLRPSTRVLTDRVIDHYPYFSSYVTTRALAKNLDALSTLSHELTHYWTFLGPLGGYFSVIALELRFMKEFADRREAIEGLGLSPAETAGALEEAKIKLSMFWELWRPWAEGMALFAEMDLDLLDSGDLALPLTSFLACLPTPTNGGSAEPFEEIERMQNEARLAVLTRYRRNLYFGRTTAGNERYYFTGHALVTALWNRWSERDPRFASSVVFFRTLLWLTNSAFDDLVPDWQLQRDPFGQALLGSFGFYLKQLFEIPDQRLGEMAAVAADPVTVVSADLWRMVRDGDTAGESVAIWEARSKALVDELATTVLGPAGSDYISATSAERQEGLEGMLHASRTQVVSESEGEIRLLSDGPAIVYVAKSLQGGPTALSIIKLTQEELGLLATAAAAYGHGRVKVFQFFVERRQAGLGFTYVFALAVSYGEAVIILSHTVVSGGKIVQLEESELDSVRNALDPKVRAVRRSMVSALEVDRESSRFKAPNGFGDQVDRLYIRAFVQGPAEWIDRLVDLRLQAFLPADRLERARAMDIFDQALREPGGLKLGSVSAGVGSIPAETSSVLDRFRECARVLGQDPVVERNGRLYFVGLRASGSGHQ